MYYGVLEARTERVRGAQPCSMLQPPRRTPVPRVPSPPATTTTTTSAAARPRRRGHNHHNPRPSNHNAARLRRLLNSAVAQVTRSAKHRGRPALIPMATLPGGHLALARAEVRGLAHRAVATATKRWPAPHHEATPGARRASQAELERLTCLGPKPIDVCCTLYGRLYGRDICSYKRRNDGIALV